MNARNYQREMDNIIEKLEDVPRLLLHSCCAPCSSACLEKLCSHFKVTVFFFNPNITEQNEYALRLEEEKRFIQTLNANNGFGTGPFYPIDIIEGRYDCMEFFAMAKGLEKCPEGGERCFKCYELRLLESAKIAKEGHFDYFTTTLTLSPLKNAAKLNEIGEQVARKLGISFLPSDFKKKNGYKRSIELSKEYDLYRQNYCGCVYSKR